ncbi:MAG TPA: DUF1501 domain-containing protein [Verrucomicrobiota bacterium]|nr:DUF1501 domain-containing protein [Verrucomicrobiota bacterium]
MNHPALHTRRSFLRSTALGGAFTCSVPSFLAATFDQLHAQAADRATAPVTGRDGPILVVLQLAGGNDGLNTVVPYSNDHYQRARPKLALKAEAVLKLNDGIGLHPSLRGFKSLFDTGQLAIVQAVGYPNPNRSHFRSTDIWMTATDSDRVSNLGWIGRYFDNACAGADPTVGLAVGRQSPLAFAAKKPTGVALENPEAYRFADLDEPATGERAASGAFYRQMNASFDDSESATAGGSVGMVGGTPVAVSPLDYLERTALDAQVSSDQIRKVSSGTKNAATYPASKLGNDFRLIARLIAGGLGTRVYYVSQGGYDTHTNQAAAHARLLGDMGDAVAAFITDLKQLGQDQRVLLLTFSEFGRRVAENASAGTDHGAAAPLFIVGSRVKAGLHGPAPALAPDSLQRGDVRYQTDFRSVYASVLERWLKTPSAPILGRQFTTLDLLS